MSGLPPPSATPTYATGPVSVSLEVLQSQVASLQESLGDVQSSVKDALSHILALRTAQTKTDKAIAELQGVISVSTGVGPSGGAAHTTSGTGPEENLAQALTSVHSAIDELLARHDSASQSQLMGQELPVSITDPPNPGSTPFVYASLSVPQSEVLPVATPPPQFATSPCPASPVQKYVDASIQVCSPPATIGPSCGPSYSQRHLPGFLLVCWNTDAVTLGLSTGTSTQPVSRTAEYLTQFLRDTYPFGVTNIAVDRKTPLCGGSYPLRDPTFPYTPLSSYAVSTHVPPCPCRTMSDNSITVPTVPPATETSSTSTRASVPSLLSRMPSLTTESTGSSMVLPGTGPPCDSHVLLSSPSSSLSSLSSTPVPMPGASGLQERVGCRVGRARSEAIGAVGGSGSRLVGGPNATLGELAVLARRIPLTIQLKVPDSARSLKRKRDVNDDETEAGLGNGSVGDEHVPFGVGMSMETVSTGASASAPPHRVVEQEMPTSSAPTRPTPESFTTARLSGSAGAHSDTLPMSRKRMKKQSKRSERDAHALRPASEHARVHPQKSRWEMGLKSPVKFHVRHGRIVVVESGPEPLPEAQLQPRPRALVTPPVLQSPVYAERANQDSRAPTRMRVKKGREKKPSSSLVKLSQPTPRTTRIIKSPSTKDDARDRTWPALPILFSQWHAQFIQCDDCDKWYHYGCVGVESGDARLEPSAVFICPACHTTSVGPHTLGDHGDSCARPGCPGPQAIGDSELFFVEKLVGRKKAEGYVYMWLAKWEGYPMTQATWIPKENLVGGETKLCNAFLEDAKAEGIDLSRDVVLLRAAIEAGWEE